MMADVKMRKINCIIVKDLSRFGRNHIEMGNYLEKIFPFLGVRFIAVNDDFDSENMGGQEEALCVNLKNLVNEMYARDIAVKVKASRREKWEQGSYTGGMPPYGYKVEWEGDKRYLAVEHPPCDVVKKIFELFLCGKSIGEVKEWLYQERVFPPVEYHKTGQVYWALDHEALKWQAGSIKMILTNPLYMGCLIRGADGQKASVIRERKELDSGEWQVRRHTHEAIVSEDDFFSAVGRFGKRPDSGRRAAADRNPLTKDLFTEVFCYGEDGQKCNSTSIALPVLSGIVKRVLMKEAALSAVSPEELENQVKREWRRQAAKLDRQIENITKIESEQYLKYRMGEINEDVFQRTRKQSAQKAALLRRKREKIAKGSGFADERKGVEEYFLSYKEGGLAAEAAKTFIDRIEVYPGRRIEIRLSFRGHCF